MAGWLSRATSLFQQTPPAPEPFEVECDCGAKVVGQRTNTFQKPGCPRCERPVFVLPANVYPAPKLKPKSKSKANSEPKKSGPPTLVAQETQTEPSPGNQGAGRPSPSKPKAIEATETPAPPKVWLPPPPKITPLRMITAAILLVSTVTISGLWYRHRIETAKTVVAQSADAGMAALKEQEFIRAALELDQARQAVDVLGRTDQAANEIRRLSREATTLSKLASGSLTEVIEETLATAKSGQAEPLRLSSSNRGAWVIFDSRITPVGSGGKGYCRVDAPIMVGNTTVRIELDSPIVRNASATDESGDLPRVIFAAQLEQMAAPRGEPPTSVLTLNGKTAFLWTSYDTFAAIGYQPFDAESEELTKAVLKHQHEITQ